jgi:hypothetical protein
MTPIADMVERMLSENYPAGAIVMAVRAMENVTSRVTLSSRDASRDASRSVTQEMARVRSLNYRNRKKNQQVAKANDVASAVVIEAISSRDASRFDSTRDLLTSSFLLPEDPLGTSKKERKQEVVARARGTRLKTGEFLTQPFIDEAIKLGVQPGRVAPLWDEFVDYWAALPGSRGTKLDWLATWRNRIRQIVSKGPQRNGKASSDHALGGFSGLAATLRRKIAEDEAADQNAAGGEPYDRH